MAKKKSSKPVVNSVQMIVDDLQAEIDSYTRELSDEEYINVLEGIESYCSSCVVAKREEKNK